MIRSCPTKDELLCFASAGLVEDRAAEIDEHLASCPDCRHDIEQWKQLEYGIAAEVAGLQPDRARSVVMQRIRATEAAAPARSSLRGWQFVLGSAVVAAAGVLFIATQGTGEPDPSGTFQSRGSTSNTELARKVGADFLALQEGVLTKLTQGAQLSGQTGLTLSYVNAVPDKKVYMLAFALDAEREVHWLYPAYIDPETDPEAITLRASVMETVLPETIELDTPATGTAELVWVASFDRLRVSSIEKLRKDALTVQALKKRWPTAEVGRLRVQFER